MMKDTQIDKIMNFNRKNIVRTGVLIAVTLGMFIYVKWNWGKEGIPKAYYLLAIALVLCIFQLFDFRVPDLGRKIGGYSILFVMPLITFVCMEFMNNNSITEIKILCVLLNYALYLAVYLFFYIIFNRIWVSILIGNLVFYVYIILNYFVYQYKGTPIRAYDIYAVQTALNVVGGYELNIGYNATIILICFYIMFLLAMMVKWKEKSKIRRGRFAVCVIVLSVVVGRNCFNIEFIEKQEIKPDVWDIHKSASEHGMFYDFVAGIPYLWVQKPDGYTSEVAKKIQEINGTQMEANKEVEMINPDIIVIMNESYSDLSVLGELETSVECMEYFYSLEENVVRGKMYVPIRGGLTCNTEFEFLTGFSCAFLPDSSIAFQTVVKEGTYNLGNDLKENGYYTTFVHPYWRNGWNRSAVYQHFNFDETYFLENMEFDVEKDYFRNLMSDDANYRIVLEQYEKQKEQEKKVFLFNVTMQNHGGYLNDISEVKILIPEVEDPEAEEYFSVLKRSDASFHRIIEYYSDIETPTVILMFGDHQPTLGNFTSIMQEGTDSDDIEGKMEEYCVPYLIWANYDIEEKVCDDISCNYLQVLLKEVAGQPLNEYQRYLKCVMQSYPVITERGVKDAEGNWYKFSEAKEFEKIKEYSYVQYWNLIENGIK